MQKPPQIKLDCQALRKCSEAATASRMTKSLFPVMTPAPTQDMLCIALLTRPGLRLQPPQLAAQLSGQPPRCSHHAPPEAW